MLIFYTSIFQIILSMLLLHLICDEFFLSNVKFKISVFVNYLPKDKTIALTAYSKHLKY